VPVGVYTATTSYFVPRVTRCLFRFFVFSFVDVIIIIIVAINYTVAAHTETIVFSTKTHPS